MQFATTNFKKTLLSSLVFGLTISSIQPNITEEKLLYKNDNWGFIGKKFYDEPLYLIKHRTTKSLNILKISVPMLATSFISILVSLAPFVIYDELIGKPDEHKETALSYSSLANTYIGLPIGFILGTLWIKYEIKESKMNAYEKTLKNFISNWNEYSELVPDELKEYLQILNDQYETHNVANRKKKAYKAIGNIHKILIKYDARYAAKYQEDHKILREFITGLGLA